MKNLTLENYQNNILEILNLHQIKEPQVIFHMGWYDGPENGFVIFKRKPHYFHIIKYIAMMDPRNSDNCINGKIFLVLKVSDAHFKYQQKWNSYFKDSLEKDNLNKYYKDKSEKYSKYIEEKLILGKPVAWFSRIYDDYSDNIEVNEEFLKMIIERKK